MTGQSFSFIGVLVQKSPKCTPESQKSGNFDQKGGKIKNYEKTNSGPGNFAVGCWIPMYGTPKIKKKWNGFPHEKWNFPFGRSNWPAGFWWKIEICQKFGRIKNDVKSDLWHHLSAWIIANVTQKHIMNFNFKKEASRKVIFDPPPSPPLPLPYFWTIKLLGGGHFPH